MFLVIILSFLLGIVHKLYNIAWCSGVVLDFVASSVGVFLEKTITQQITQNLNNQKHKYEELDWEENTKHH
jgi:hypothetical protein